MAAPIYAMTATQVRNAPSGKHSDGGGLYLYKLRTGTRWVFRFTLGGKRHEMGLGGYPAISLADARRMADKHRAVLQNGADPIDNRKNEQHSAKALYEANNPEARKRRLLCTIAPKTFEARKFQLKDDGKAGRWYSPLQKHVLPALGKKPVGEITGAVIASALKPIWHSQPDVARKAITRLGACLSYARADGMDVDRNAVADARELLGKQMHTATHIPAMDWRDVPAFYLSLEGGDVVQMALQLLILTGVRSKPLRFANVDQIDGDIWTIPAELVKGNKGKTTEFRVPLSDEAQRIVERTKALACDGFLFPGLRKGVISDASMARHMERRGMDERPHGFRSSFRTWADDSTNTAYEVKETALGHKVGSTVSRAYQRTDYLDERAVLAERWAIHITGAKGAVIPIRKAKL